MEWPTAAKFYPGERIRVKKSPDPDFEGAEGIVRGVMTMEIIPHDSKIDRFTKPPAYAVCLDKCGSEHYHAFLEDHLESAEQRQ